MLPPQIPSARALGIGRIPDAPELRPLPEIERQVTAPEPPAPIAGRGLLQAQPCRAQQPLPPAAGLREEIGSDGSPLPGRSPNRRRCGLSWETTLEESVPHRFSKPSPADCAHGAQPGR